MAKKTNETKAKATKKAEGLNLESVALVQRNFREFKYMEEREIENAEKLQEQRKKDIKDNFKIIFEVIVGTALFLGALFGASILGAMFM